MGSHYGSPGTLQPDLHNKRSHCKEKPADCDQRKPAHSKEDLESANVN